MYLKQKYEVFSLVVGATAVNSLDWEQNQTHYFHIENCCQLSVKLSVKFSVKLLLTWNFEYNYCA